MDTPPEIRSLDAIEILDARDLGTGYISKVKMGRHKVTGKNYAVKIVR